ncbi:MAG: prohead protease/major capsid protein fusion protein [Myxococcota bacterium]
MKAKLKQMDCQIPRETLRASLEPSTVDAEARTVQLRFYTGAYVRRYSWEHGSIELAFEMKPSAVRMGRLNSGAPLLNSHADWDLSDVIGVVENASIKGGEGIATVRFSDREEVEPIFRDVQNGIIRNVSMGAVVHQMKEVTKKGDCIKKFLAIDWEPMELSFVAVGADAGAQALSDRAGEFPCRITFSAEESSDAPQGGTMEIKVRLLADVEELGAKGDIVKIAESDFDEKLHSKELKPEAKASATPAVEPLAARAGERAVSDAIEADQARVKEIKRLQAHFNLDDMWAMRHIKKNTSPEQAALDAAEERSKNAPIIDGAISLGEDFESIGWRADRMVEALAARAVREECPEPAKQYALSSIPDCAFECLSLNGRTRGRSLDARRRPEEVVELALHTTSDFPLVLANVLNKTMQMPYEQANPTFRTIAARKTFKDFRAHQFLRAGDFPVPLQVDEHGEFKSGTMSESGEAVTAVTYGRILGISRQTLINDDVGAFADIGGNAGRRIVDFENQTFYALCILPAAGLGPTMSASSGGVAVYNGAHSNIAASGALDNTRLESAFSLMLAQTSLDGLKLNVMPKYLLVSPASFGLARRLLTPTNPTQASEINTFAGMIEPLTDANLTGVRFYVLADPAELPNYVYGTLEGQSGPRTEVKTGFRVDGIEVKVAIDFACGAIEYRGGVTGAGS